MANHRMFSNRISNSAKFLQMPLEAQALYFHLILRADDDGVVEAYPVTKLLGTSPDVFKVLLAKSFIRQLNEDQVVLIDDWLEHNRIRADRKINSIYKHLIPPDIKLLKPIPRSDVIDNSGRLSGGQSTDGLSKVKLSKVKLSKVKLSKVREDTPYKIAQSFFSEEKHYEEIITTLKEKIPSEVLVPEIEKFVLYWTEPNKSGTKVKWEMERTFDVKRRLKTWFERKQQWSNEKLLSKKKQLII